MMNRAAKCVPNEISLPTASNKNTAFSKKILEAWANFIPSIAVQIQMIFLFCKIV